MKKAIVLNRSPVSVPVFYYGRKVQMNCRPLFGGHISYIIKRGNDGVSSKMMTEVSSKGPETRGQGQGDDDEKTDILLQK